MGTESGFLGIGAPEVFTTIAVGWLILGPAELYKLSKEIGKFVSNFRSVGDDLTAQWTDNMEGQMAVEEIRKAQRDLNDAFSFRRSINFDERGGVQGPEDVMPGMEAAAGAEAASAAAATAAATAAPPSPAATGPPRKIRRRVKKRPAPPAPEPEPRDDSPPEASDPVTDTTGYDISQDIATEPWNPVPVDEASRFSQQLDVDAYNKGVMAAADALPSDPLQLIQQQLTLLDEEQDARLQMEREYFGKKRKILEDALSTRKS